MSDQELFDAIKANAPQIKTDAECGDLFAKHIITLYTMYAKFPENGSLGLLHGAFDDWKKSKTNPSLEPEKD